MAVLNTSALRKNSTTDALAKLRESMEKKIKFQNDDDSILWKPPVDKDTKQGFARIKFLPAKYEDQAPYVTVYRHAFKGKAGKWYINECGTHLGKPCPVCQMNSEIFQKGREYYDAEVKKYGRGRVKQYVANILVLEDRGNPENNGKVLVWRFGNSIYNLIQKCIQGNEMMGDDPMNPFAFFDSCELKFVSEKNNGGFPNYDNSRFVACKDLYDGDAEKLTELMEQLHDLSHFVRDDLFNYDKQVARLNLCDGVYAEAMSKEDYHSSKDYGSFDAPFEPDQKPVAEKPAPVEKPKASPMPSVEEDDNDDLEFFRRIQNAE